MIKASEDKTFPGAIVASLASPWGQSVPRRAPTPNGEPAYFGSYREVFARDLYEAFTGLLVDGDLATARAAVRFLFDQQQLADGSMPRNSLLNGKAAPDTGGLQLDETSYPILMAQQAGLGGDGQLWPTTSGRPPTSWSPRPVRRGGALGGADGLLAVDDRGRDRRADRGVGDRDASRATPRGPGCTRPRRMTSSAASSPGRSPRPARTGRAYFIRLSKTGDPNAAISYSLGNGGPTVDQRVGHRRRLPGAGPARRAAGHRP